MDAIGSEPRGRYLEIGCGAGTLLAELSASGFDALGMETSEEAFVMAQNVLRESGELAELVAVPAAEWSDAFDIVAAFDVLEHIQDDGAAIRSWKSWLKRGGKMLLTVPAHPSRWGSGDVWAGHFRRYTKAGLVDLVQAAGLNVQRIECYGFPLANVTEFLGEFYYRRALRQRESANLQDRKAGNALSGIDRGQYRRVSSLLLSSPGRTLIRMADMAQRLTLGRDWGSGYLLTAVRS